MISSRYLATMVWAAAIGLVGCELGGPGMNGRPPIDWMSIPPRELPVDPSEASPPVEVGDTVAVSIAGQAGGFVATVGGVPAGTDPVGDVLHITIPAAAPVGLQVVDVKSAATGASFFTSLVTVHPAGSLDPPVVPAAGLPGGKAIIRAGQRVMLAATGDAANGTLRVNIGAWQADTPASLGHAQFHLPPKTPTGQKTMIVKHVINSTTTPELGRPDVVIRPPLKLSKVGVAGEFFVFTGNHVFATLADAVDSSKVSVSVGSVSAPVRKVTGAQRVVVFEIPKTAPLGQTAVEIFEQTSKGKQRIYITSVTVVQWAP